MLDNLKGKVCLFFVVAILATSANAQQIEPFVDVLVAVSADAYSTWNPVDMADDLGARMSLVMSNSALASGQVTGKRFRFRPYLLPALYAGENGTPETIDAYVLSGADSALTAARDSATGTLHLGVPNYDILILLVKDLKKSIGSSTQVCGSAEPIFDDNNDWPLVYGIGDNHPIDPGAGENKYLVVINTHVNCFLSRTKIVGHELGHIFGADHQLLLPSESCPDDLGDCFDQWPVDYNHPAIYYDANLNVTESTIMGASINYNMALMFSDSGPGLTTPMGNSRGDSTKDVVEVIERTWVHVASYRNPAPVPCVIHVNQVCDGGIPQTTVTPTVAGWGMTNIDLDFRRVNSNVWNPIYNGAPTCPIFNNAPALLDSVVSALVATATGYITGCTVYVEAFSCGGGPGGGPGGGNN